MEKVYLPPHGKMRDENANAKKKGSRGRHNPNKMIAQEGKERDHETCTRLCRNLLNVVLLSNKHTFTFQLEVKLYRHRPQAFEALMEDLQQEDAAFTRKMSLKDLDI
ncbi:hypothetical protein AVEN_242198-1 [Araneus ventricosus]|uniref:Uncharacterized protein n=1 Tax=Araneus ventricosus TaxID=182803 RepID=A0A4Y2HDR4_ARAVE|nr:hypothetical protein AVEN_242198-1 [Araneus ventricosus]